MPLISATDRHEYGPASTALEKLHVRSDNGMTIGRNNRNEKFG
ncbi:hypothetical protein SAMN04488095_1674 [Jannaschia pohangensis]|uniref:Uncharacterized protein n=1 Tax=Jannaschia pohangensis TaxID=390807 RepID=A0A1I3LY96_9RHOB|nr:hypothetical protein SAMN04488095_1674 [Jannaschia pohangensis]